MRRIYLLFAALMVIVSCMAQIKNVEYPGGAAAFEKFVKKNLKYPESSKKNSVEGYCDLKFTVNVDGTTKNACVVGSTGDVDLDNEALRLVSLMKLKPAMKNGVKVEGDAKCSVCFQLKQPKQALESDLKSGIGFPGGSKALNAYVEEHVEYPQSCITDSVSGVCTVMFVVNADSTISNKRVMQSCGNIELDREAIRVISCLQGMLAPAVNKKGKSVAMSTCLSVNFCAHKDVENLSGYKCVTYKMAPTDTVKNDCEVVFVVGVDGKASNVKMVVSSGDALIDKKIVSIVKDSCSFGPAIRGNKKISKEYRLSIPKRKLNTIAWDEAYEKVEEAPEFPGGTKALFQWIQQNMKYPADSRRKGKQGVTIVAYVVETDGSITDVHILKSSGTVELDKEAMRVVESMPKWIPGRHNGEPVRVNFKFPIRFRLN